MVPIQKQLWRQTAWIGIITGIVAVLSLASDISLGLNQAYYHDAVVKGVAPALVELNTPLDYVGITFLGTITFIPRLMMGLLYIIMLRHCWIPNDKVLSIEVFRLIINGGITVALITGIAQFISLLYLQDEHRYLAVVLGKMGNLILALFYLAGTGMILYYAFPHIPRRLGIGLGIWLVFAVAYTLLSAHPSFTSFFGIFMAHGGGMILGFYMLWQTYALDYSTETPKIT